MIETGKYSLSIITHNSLFVTSKKTGDNFSWMVYIKEEDELFEVTASLLKLDNEKIIPTSRRKIFQTLTDATNYIISTTRNFHQFELKIFKLYEKYSDEFLQEKIEEWYNSGV